MTQQMTTCHCIIGHPTKAKFLAIQHSGQWSPPTVMYPARSLDYSVNLINQGIMNKYGLKTRILRPLLSAPNYQCIEAELPPGGGSKNLKAVWVDRQQYLKFRAERNGMPDPFERWLNERESGQTPALRAPWQIPGWFKKAETWIQFKLDEQGLQVTGEVEQFRGGWNASCLLRVPTSQGLIYFKAGYRKPPGEAALTQALVERWPDALVRPLVADNQANWLMNTDFRQAQDAKVQPSDLPECVGVLAQIQVESAECLADLEALGCPRHDLAFLAKAIELKDTLVPYLQEGNNGLDDAEIAAFFASLSVDEELCQRLQAFQLPDTLIHMDFRTDNLVRQNDRFRIIDWADVAIGLPFFSLNYFYEHNDFAQAGKTRAKTSMSLEQPLLDEIAGRYLQSFTQFESNERLQQAFELTRQLFRLWSLVHLREELKWAENSSPDYIKLVVGLQETARWMAAHPRVVPVF